VRTETETEKALKQAKLLMCVYDKKIKVSPQYNGTVLKETGSITNLQIPSGFKYFGYENDEVITAKSYVAYDGVDCYEYVLGNTKVYNVTDVPPGSYLKYVQEDGTYEVFPLKEISYKQAIWNKMRDMEKTMQEASENVFSVDKEDVASKLRNLQAAMSKEYDLIEIPQNTPLKDFMKFFSSSNEATKDLKYSAQKAKEQKAKEETKTDLKNFAYLDGKLTASEKENAASMYDVAKLGMLYALLLTLIIEGILAAPFGWKFVGLVCLANIITNPAINAVVWHYKITSTPIILLLEILVVLVEWGIFAAFIRKNYGKLLLFSLVANAVSYLSGFLFPI